MKIHICTPTYGNSFAKNYVVSLAQTLLWAPGAGATVTFSCFENSFLPYGRDVLTNAMIKGDAEVCFFIDSDVGWTTADLEHALSAPLSVEMLSGLYPRKEPPYTPPVQLMPKRVGGLEQLASCGAGWLMLRRSALARLADHTVEDRLCGPPGDRMLALWTPEFLPGVGTLSEDVSFCRLFRAAGGEIWADPRIQLTHQAVTLLDLRALRGSRPAAVADSPAPPKAAEPSVKRKAAAKPRPKR